MKKGFLAQSKSPPTIGVIHIVQGERFLPYAKVDPYELPALCTPAA